MLLSCAKPVALDTRTSPIAVHPHFWGSRVALVLSRGGINLGSGQSCSPFVCTSTSINHHDRPWASGINDPFSDDVDRHGLFDPLLAASGTTPQCIPSRACDYLSRASLFSAESRHYARSARRTFSSCIQEHLSSSRNTFLFQSRRRRRRWRSLSKMH